MARVKDKGKKNRLMKATKRARSVPTLIRGTICQSSGSAASRPARV